MKKLTWIAAGFLVAMSLSTTTYAEEIAEEEIICETEDGAFVENDVVESDAVDPSDRNYYIVTFDNCGIGNGVGSQTVHKGLYAHPPTEPRSKDYAFVGWYKEPAYTTAWDFENDTVNDDITLYAKWYKIPYFELSKDEFRLTYGETDAVLIYTESVDPFYYQWYVNDSQSVNGATQIEGATSPKFEIENLSVGEWYLYCKMTHESNGYTTNTAFVHVLIEKAVYPREISVEREYLFSKTASDSINVNDLVPEDVGKYTLHGPYTEGNFYPHSIYPMESDGTIRYKLQAAPYECKGSILVQVRSENYENFYIYVKIHRSIFGLYEKKKNGDLVTLTEKELSIGAKFNAIASFAEGAVTDSHLVWVSSDPNVATVSQSGLVTAYAMGTTIISVQSEELPRLEFSFRLRVKEPISDVKLNKRTYAMGLDEYCELTAKILPTSASHKLEWEASTDDVDIIVSGDTLSATIIGMDYGSAKVTAKAADGSGVYDSCTFSIGKPVTDFEVKSKTDYVSVGKTLAMSVDFGKEKPKNQSIIWEVSDENIATITDKGVLTGVSEGIVSVIATSESNPNVNAVKQVSVYVPVKSCTLNTKSTTLSTNSAGFELYVDFGDVVPTGVEVGFAPDVTFEVSDKYSDNLTVTDTGFVIPGAKTAKNIPVKVTVNAFNNFKKVLTCKVTVTSESPLKGVKLSKTSVTLNEGDQIALDVRLNPISPDDNVDISFESSNKSVATVDDYGNVTAVSAGKTSIKVVADNGKKKYSAACSVTVLPSISGITFTNTDPLVKNGLAVGKTYTLKKSMTLTGKGKGQLLWISSDEKIAAVSTSGVIKAVAPGIVTITAMSPSDNTICDSVTFTVFAPLQSIGIDKSVVYLGSTEGTKYGRIYLTKIVPETATDISVKWTTNSKNVSLATITNGEVLSAGDYGDSAVVGDGECLGIEAHKPGIAKLTGITTDGSKKTVVANVIVRGVVTNFTVSKKSGGREYDGSMNVTLTPGAELIITPIFEINGVTLNSDKATYLNYAKYTDTNIAYRSTNISCAEVTRSGVIKVNEDAQHGETATIVARTAGGGKTVEINVTVK